MSRAWGLPTLLFPGRSPQRQTVGAFATTPRPRPCCSSTSCSITGLQWRWSAARRVPAGLPRACRLCGFLRPPSARSLLTRSTTARRTTRRLRSCGRAGMRPGLTLQRLAGCLSPPHRALRTGPWSRHSAPSPSSSSRKWLLSSRGRRARARQRSTLGATSRAC